MDTQSNSSNIRIIRPLAVKACQECKGFTLLQRIRRHLDFLKDDSLGINVRRGHRYKALLLLRKLALREGKTINRVLLELNLSPGDLRIFKNKN